MLNPREVVEPAEAAYRQSGAPLVEVEGFVGKSSAGANSCGACIGSQDTGLRAGFLTPGKLSRHPRLSMVYRNPDRFAPHGDSSL